MVATSLRPRRRAVLVPGSDRCVSKLKRVYTQSVKGTSHSKIRKNKSTEDGSSLSSHGCSGDTAPVPEGHRSGGSIPRGRENGNP